MQSMQLSSNVASAPPPDQAIPLSELPANCEDAGGSSAAAQVLIELLDDPSTDPKNPSDPARRCSPAVGYLLFFS